MELVHHLDCRETGCNSFMADLLPTLHILTDYYI